MKLNRERPTGIVREEITVEVVRRHYRLPEQSTQSVVNVLRNGVPQYSLGPYVRDISLAEALQVVSVELRLKGENE